MANFDILADQGRQRFLTYSPQTIASRFGIPFRGGSLPVSFLGQTYTVRCEDGRIFTLEGCAAGPSEMLSIYDYLCRTEEPVLLSGRLCGVNALPGVGQSNPNPDALFAKAAAALGTKGPDSLSAACRALGGDPFPVGDLAFTLPVFPELPVVFQFWAGDEEFPDTVRFLWDENTLRYLHYETLYYIMLFILQSLDNLAD